MKINVVGTSGSGKSTFARALAEVLDYPYIEMDAIFWGKDWYEPPDEIFFSDLKTAIEAKNWVLDGNYTRTIEIKWKDVDQVIWIDYGFLRTLYQAVKRALSRAVSKKELWPGTGNRESFRRLFSKDSIVLWMLKTYHSKRTRYLSMMRDSAYDHIEFIQLRSPKEAAAFLERVVLPL